MALNVIAFNKVERELFAFHRDLCSLVFAKLVRLNVPSLLGKTASATLQLSGVAFQSAAV